MKRNISLHLTVSCLVLLLFAGSVHAAPRVAVSIAPVHSLVAMVMQGIGEPELILPQGQSPHTYALTPSTARKILDADLVVLISPDYEAGLRNIILNVEPAKRLQLLDHGEELKLLSQREGGVWGKHTHGDGNEDEHADHEGTDGAEGQDNGTGEEAKEKRIDPHIWLSPYNAASIVTLLAHHLGSIDPVNAQQYAANAALAILEIQEQSGTLSAKLESVQMQPLVVYHDAYQYFEKSFDLNVIGTVTLGADRNPGIRRIRELRQIIRDQGVRCLFTEPQFTPKLAANFTEDSRIQTGTLDPIGAALTPGLSLWPQLMSNIADALVECLESSS